MYKFHSVKHATSTYYFLFAISAIFKGNITAKDTASFVLSYKSLQTQNKLKITVRGPLIVGTARHNKCKHFRPLL